MIRGRVNDANDDFGVDMVLPFLVRLPARPHVRERIFRHDLVSHCQLEKLSYRPFDRASRRRRPYFSASAAAQPSVSPAW